jgi:hypothetical protein
MMLFYRTTLKKVRFLMIADNRQPEHSTHSSSGLAKGHISTLPGGRHFYFAAALGPASLTTYQKVGKLPTWRPAA